MPIRFVKHVAGLALLTWNLVDIVVTVLYARAGSGLIAPHVERLFWRLIRRSNVGGRGRRKVVRGAIACAALVIHPALGSGVRATGGQTRSRLSPCCTEGLVAHVLRALVVPTLHRHVSALVFLTALPGTAVTSL